jgi:CRP-like cAMP-binding protein
MSERLADDLSLIPIFSTLQPEELRTLEGQLYLRKVAPGELVFREGEKGDYLCFVASGSLEVIKLNQGAQPVVISKLAKGSSIGEMALLDRLTRSASVRAATAASLVVLTRESFEHILAEHPAIGIKIMRGIALLLSFNLRKTSDRLAEFMPSLA